jgi:hypothetical protein
MFSKRAKLVSISSVMGLFVAAAWLIMSAPAYATDIAWHSKGEPAKWSWVGSLRTNERTGTVEFKTGEKATFVCNGMNHSLDANRKQPWDTQCVYRFDDLSAITTHSAGTFDDVTQESKGAGKFVSGSGRFEGIAGEFTQVGHFSGDTVETDAVGSYSLAK